MSATPTPPSPGNPNAAIFDAVANGDVDVVEHWLNWSMLRDDNQTLILNDLLTAVLQRGTSPEMLGVLFDRSAVLTEDTGSVDRVRRVDGHPRAFFEILVAKGWGMDSEAFERAMIHGRDVAEVLLANGASGNISCLRKVATFGDVPLMDLLLAKIDRRDRVLAIQEALLAPPVEQISEPMLAGIINDANLLHAASFQQHTSMVKYLLDRGARVDFLSDPAGQYEQYPCTALMRAVDAWKYSITPKPEVVKILVEAGADPSLEGEHGYAARLHDDGVHDAAIGGRPRAEILRLLRVASDERLALSEMMQ